MSLSNFYCVKNASGYTITAMREKVKKVIIPEGVTQIAKDAFSETEIESVVFPKSLKSVKNGAFYLCENLKSITFQQDGELEEIEEYAFACCYSLKKVDIPKSVKFIRLGAFNACESLISVSLYDEVQVLKAESFTECTDLKVITVHGTHVPPDWQKGWKDENVEVKLLNPYETKLSAYTKTVSESFSEDVSDNKTQTKVNFIDTCRLDEFIVEVVKDGFKIIAPKDKQIKNLIVPREVTEIGSKAFFECYALENVLMHQGVLYVGEEAFSECTSLKQVDFGENTKFASGCFKGCISLEKAHAYKKTLSRALFANSGLKRITFSPDVEEIPDYCFYNCKVERVVLPNDIESIMTCAFANCSQLKEIILGENLSNVWAKAFYKCAMLESIKIPRGVTHIMEETFYGCASLSQVDLGLVCEIRSEAFAFCTALKSIKIPKSVYTVRKNAFCNALKQVKIVGKLPHEDLITPDGWEIGWINGYSDKIKVTYLKS